MNQVGSRCPTITKPTFLFLFMEAVSQSVISGPQTLHEPSPPPTGDSPLGSVMRAGH